MPNEYRTLSSIPWTSPVTIQMATTGTQFSNTAQADTTLVFENGIWKFPRIAGAAGAIVLPLSDGAGKKVGPVRLAAWVAQFGASAGWELHVAGNPNNTTDTPYPAADAALYAEGDLIVASGSGTWALSAAYGLNGASTAAPVIFPGQRLYLVTTTASNPLVRLTFAPLFNSPGGL